MSLRLSNARYDVIDGYSVLRVDINGRTATMDSEWKPALRELGLVRVGEEFADIFRPIVYRSPDGTETILEGFSDDPRLFRLFEQFWNDPKCEKGPVAIPEGQPDTEAEALKYPPGGDIPDFDDDDIAAADRALDSLGQSPDW